MSNKSDKGIRIALISLHGLIRGSDPEYGRDEDTGGQTRYVIELARALSKREDVAHVDLITRHVIDERVDSDYAKLIEPLNDKASIVRIAFGPKRYISKTRLWPYMESFVDQCLQYFQKNRSFPDVIHGHYAESGYGGGQLARLLGVPFVFTGHSLGRIKKERLLESGISEEKMEERYRLSRRIEAEEFALETCSLICTSTHQEVKEQYECYEHYVPERMEVIPPGIDLGAFHPPIEDEAQSNLVASIRSFLKEPDKPIIAAMARPDERKNLEMLVKVYGESPALQRRANLVLILGSRDDIRSMPAGQRTVLTRILTLIDVYDLYGKVAYPKQHEPREVPTLYREITRTGGVFVNAAMTEPFGLTLLEAAASGAPIVATNNGGPNDIIGNCHNGCLVDPFDPESIERALMHALLEPEQWSVWSKAGLKNVHEYYSWDTHCDRYMRSVKEIVVQADPNPILRRGRKPRNLPQIDRLVVADIDNTLTGDDDAMHRFFDLIAQVDENIGFGIATGRCYEEALQLIDAHDMPRPEVLIAAVGTEIYYGKNLTKDTSWQQHIDFRWEPEAIRQLLATVDGLHYQDEHEQSRFKISYGYDAKVAPKVAAIRRMLRENGIRANLIVSLGMFLDVIPFRAGSGLSIRHMAYKWGFPMESVLVAGDSGNDETMLSGNTLGVVVGNYSKELEKLRRHPRVYFAEGNHAAGIIEGIDYYNFLEDIRIPNDRVTEPDA
ncbi:MULTISPECIES: HAD-IIB family hydrolase [unclassified Lentimonas]|uniref:HAD-IIB family hydrolase n=1 Tax=unclassified Lentimonas TaxID=2630993 RepID=UPI001322C818|nr:MULTISPECIES: HAD-IIB family hydrolase [unclassified Lentimonas]CAA6690598.1 Sucrose phosphate synthase [Lentimonas sp. CC10]CAA6695278.1 Sucrose phosphate synthase [Lentimonas sp. CC19]CAA7068855.1 Sucrose phosphate synthase [Lentimonas sp. CC11]